MTVGCENLLHVLNAGEGGEPLVVILLNLGANAARQGLVDGLSLEVLAARGAEAVGGVHGALERVTGPSVFFLVSAR